MRIRISFVVAILTVLVLASSGAWAQGPSSQADVSTNKGKIAIAGVVADVDGEEARFRRYGDSRDGVNVDLDMEFETSGWLTRIFTKAVGRRDQQYFAGIEQQGRVGASFTMTGIPVFYSARAQTPYVASGGVLTMDLENRQQLEDGTLLLSDYINGLPLTDALTKRSEYLAEVYAFVAPDWKAEAELKLITKSGQQPYFGSFGFSDVVEIPLPLDYRTTNVTAGTEWGNQKGLFRVQYLGSWFNNDNQTIVWDQPNVTEDRSNATSRGRLAAWPNNTYQSISGTGSVAFAGRSRLTGTVAAGVMSQDEALLPHTINSALEVIPLDRMAADAEARTLLVNLNFTSRPTRLVRFKARYRYHDLDKRTPAFDGDRYVRMDYSMRTGGGDSHPYSVKRQSVDAEVGVSPGMAASFMAGYGYEAGDRTFRVIPELSQNKFWVGFDSIGNQYFSLRTKYEYSTRDGTADLDILHAVHEREELRHFDVAARDRNQFTARFSATPTPETGVNFSVAFGKDEFKADLHDSPIAQLGLLDNDHRIFTVGFNAAPRDDVYFDVYYVHEQYDTLQRSQAGFDRGEECVQQCDPAYEWTDDGSEKVNTFGFNLSADRIRDLVDLGLGWSYTDAESLYHYAVGGAMPTPEQLPPIENTLNRFTADADFWVTPSVAIGFVYWYDRYDTQDLANDGGIGLTPGPPDRSPTGQYIGYFYEPYKAHTGWVRITYAWGN